MSRRGAAESREQGMNGGDTGAQALARSQKSVGVGLSIQTTRTRSNEPNGQ